MNIIFLKSVGVKINLYLPLCKKEKIKAYKNLFALRLTKLPKKEFDKKILVSRQYTFLYCQNVFM